METSLTLRNLHLTPMWSVEKLNVNYPSTALAAPMRPLLIGAMPERSKEGFAVFLKTVYVKKRGEGAFISIPGYLGNLSMYLGLTVRSENLWHKMTKLQIMQAIVTFNDLHSRDLKLSSARDLNATLSAYLDYIRHTLGQYYPALRKQAA
jgi:hypothetical protein